MLTSLYNSLSGLVGFTKALDNLSNNVANLNTPGFKANDIFFRELNSQSGSFNGETGQGLHDDIGSGVDVGGTATRFTQGKIQDTGVETDLAIDGRGFFVLLDGSDEYYTRTGQFRFDEDGNFIDPTTGFKVAFVSESGSLETLNIDRLQYSRPQQTTEISLEGALNSNDEVDIVYEGTDENSLAFDVFDVDGKAHTLQFEFTKLEGDVWQIDLVNEQGAAVTYSRTIEFTGLGSPVEAYRSFQFDLQNFEVLEESELRDAFTPGEAVEYTDGLTTDVEVSFDLGDAGLILRTESSFSLTDQTSFVFNEDGLLINASTQEIVAARTDSGELIDFSVEDKLTTPAVATENVTISGNLDSATEVNAEFPAEDADPINIEFINAEGEEDTLSIRFLREASSWTLVATGSDDNNLETQGSLNFDDNGDLIASSSAIAIVVGDNDERIEIKITDEDGEPLITAKDSGEAVTQTDSDGKLQGEITSIVFDDDGIATITYSNDDEETGPQLAIVRSEGKAVEDVTVDLSSLTAISGTSTASVEESDGRASGQIQGFSFDDFGKLTINYFNGDSTETNAVAIAQVADASRLNSIGGTLFNLESTSERVIGRAGKGGMGVLATNSIELSNVELSTEFADIIVVQRGYQASSQVLNVTNELIEELYNSVRGR
ncbi:MAG: flagellar hook-basal body complex protein [Pseudomonadales bacterium]|nr:flagellar hook-basal body complex protein [Pseudomonadales bacterium]